ncbi:MAG: hypothetical protein PHX53_19040, partial [Syntrophales bacterium]|nr:hypothetical protein [Syntrophales bacterium]
MPANSRRQLNGKFLAILAVLGLALLCNSADAERLRIIPVPPNVVPQWTPMPDLPQVYHAPNVPTDVFKHRGRYYLYWAGAWYRSKTIKGPWMRAPRPPAILAQINQEYFKTMSRRGPQQPERATPGPQREDGFLTPEGKPVVPPPLPASPRAPVPPAPPAEAYVPPPPPPEEKQPQSPSKTSLPPAPEVMAPPDKGEQPAEPDAPGEELEDQEPAP